jgi:hypothetical protein
MMVSCNAFERIGDQLHKITNKIDSHTYQEEVEDKIQSKYTDGIGFPICFIFL